jgi:hypothetical protein
MSAITLIIFVALTFGIVVGVVKPKRFRRFLLALVIGPILIGIALMTVNQLFKSLTAAQQLTVIAVSAIPVSLALLRIVLPRDVWAGVVSAMVYDVLKWILLFPIKLCRSAFQLVARREIR